MRICEKVLESSTKHAWVELPATKSETATT